MGDVAILSVSTLLLSCLVEKLYFETQNDGIKNMIEEGMIVFNQMKILAGKADYDSVVKVYSDLGDAPKWYSLKTSSSHHHHHHIYIYIKDINLIVVSYLIPELP